MNKTPSPTSDADIAHARSLLSEEELAAVNGDKDDDEADAAALAAVAAANGTPDEDEDAESDDDDGADDEGESEGGETAASAVAAAKQEPTNKEEAPAAVAAAPEDDDEPDDAPRPIEPVYKLPEDFEAKWADVNQRRADMKAKIRAGDIDVDEGDAELDKIDEERDELRSMKLRADAAADTAQQTELARRTAVADGVMRDAAKHGLAYATDPVAMAALQAQMQALSTDDKTKGKSFDWRVRKADAMVRQRFGVGAAPRATAAAPAASSKEAIKAAAAAKRKPPVGAAPKTLAGVPGSAEGASGALDDDELSALDNLEGYAFEDQLERMGKSGQEKLVKMAHRRPH